MGVPLILKSRLKFEELTSDPQLFFKILPQDWRSALNDEWPVIQDCTRVFGIDYQGKILAGGLVSSCLYPDMKNYEEIAQGWFDKGYLYIGYLYVLPEFRKNQLGSFWLSHLRKLNAAKGYWLSIEDLKLLKFYAQNDFETHQIIHTEEGTELLMVSAS